ncbi:MAG: diguanylate cyclase [Thermoanaerobaculia bacterium]
MTVAVVDDDTSIRRLVRLLLKRSGFNLIEAGTGEEATSLLFREPWDLAILDRRLPDIDGLVLCRRLKEDERLRPNYVIMLTGEAEEQEKVLGLELGADDYITKPFHPAELTARIRAGKRIVDLQKELMESNRRLERLSVTDGLTHLYNHRHFQEELSRTWEEARRYQRPLGLAMIDLDFFKKINDTWGHAAGDQVLEKASAIFTSSVRSSDLVARYGGEEFAVMMPETELDDVVAFAEKIRSLVEEERFNVDEAKIPVTVSIGAASFPHTDVGSARELIEAADRALYRAKRKGRNQVQAERRKRSHRTESTRKDRAEPN